MAFNNVLYIDTPYRPEVGSFSKPKEGHACGRYKVGQWYYCRDLFHGQLYNCNLFFFAHHSSKGRSVAEFMQKIESMVGVDPISSYGPTQRKSIMWIRPSKWWTAKAMRRSFFTVLLRAGNGYSYTKNNFEEALFSDPYTIGSKYAVERFLAGNTVYTGKKRGWYRQFGQDGKQMTNQMIDTLLIKP